MDIVNEYLQANSIIKITGSGYSYKENAPRIVCADGASLSVQASKNHYCSPRLDDIFSYDRVEVGYPSVRPNAEWEEYFDVAGWQDLSIIGYLAEIVKNFSMIKYYAKRKNWKMVRRALSFTDNACDNVYGYIPVELVVKFIEKHGGIKTD